MMMTVVVVMVMMVMMIMMMVDFGLSHPSCCLKPPLNDGISFNDDDGHCFLEHLHPGRRRPGLLRPFCYVFPFCFSENFRSLKYSCGERFSLFVSRSVPSHLPPFKYSTILARSFRADGPRGPAAFLAMPPSLDRLPYVPDYNDDDRHV